MSWFIGNSRPPLRLCILFDQDQWCYWPLCPFIVVILKNYSSTPLTLSDREAASRHEHWVVPPSWAMWLDPWADSSLHCQADRTSALRCPWALLKGTTCVPIPTQVLAMGRPSWSPASARRTSVWTGRDTWWHKKWLFHWVTCFGQFIAL